MNDTNINRAREIEERAMEYQQSFSYENFRVIRKELFAHLRDPALTIRPDSITFNTACINKLEDVSHIKIYIDHNAKQRFLSIPPIKIGSNVDLWNFV